MTLIGEKSLNMSPLSALSALFALPKNRPELLVEQARAFSGQVPLLYAVVLVNAIALAFTHFNVAPRILTVGVVAVLGLGCAVRSWLWWRSRNAPMNPDRARALLQGTIRNAAIISISFTAWSLALYPYGDSFAKAHVAFYMAITVIACIFCLMHLRIAALIVTGCVLGPMVIFFWSSGVQVFQAIAINVVIVAGAMVAILIRHSGEFSDLIESKAAIDRLANLDALTGLNNRRRFFHELDIRLAEARDKGGSLVVGIIDLDGFKPVNDTFGHATGDRLLVEVGSRLLSLPEKDLFIARLGGDEFGLIIDRSMTDAELEFFGKTACDLLRKPFNLPGVVAEICGSIGFCTFPRIGVDAKQLFERADYALYYAKQNLKGDAVIFSERHEEEIRELGRVGRALLSANFEHEMQVAFQPIFDVTNKSTIAFEALARWESPEIGPIAPGVFIRAAERSGQITELTRCLISKTLKAACAWPMHLRVAINLSARDIASMDTVRQIVEIVQTSPIAPHRIDFEITETAIVCDFDQAREALLALRELGARIALDDFGTGHSSLSYVRLLPIDKLKIDASFVTDIDHHRPSEDIVRTVLSLCENMRLGCVVEGVETHAQLEKLHSLGVKEVQGYYFGRPMQKDAVADHLSRETLASSERRNTPQSDSVHQNDRPALWKMSAS
jgi:diguanylate cyclase (GGDEF)-like protein